jgi:hypothetical protein
VSPTVEPMAKVSAESRKGGTSPDASVNNASSAHIATALKPISVAFLIYAWNLNPKWRPAARAS